VSEGRREMVFPLSFVREEGKVILLRGREERRGEACSVGGACVVRLISSRPIFESENSNELCYNRMYIIYVRYIRA
jgi:hypothetical protein